MALQKLHVSGSFESLLPIISGLQNGAWRAECRGILGARQRKVGITNPVLIVGSLITLLCASLDAQWNVRTGTPPVSSIVRGMENAQSRTSATNSLSGNS